MNNKTMMIIKTYWHNQESFKMIPVSLDCPYVEVIFDPKEKVLAVIGKDKKSTFHMLPKLNDKGDIMYMAGNKLRPNGKEYMEERKTLESYHEYYIGNKEEIQYFLNLFAINSDQFNLEYYLEKKEEETLEAV